MNHSQNLISSSPGSSACPASQRGLLLGLLCFSLLFPVCLPARVWAQEDPAAVAEKRNLEFFENKIRPVLATHCYTCHSAKAAEEGKLKGELRLDTRETTLAGGESGPAVVPGKPDDSLLLSALRHDSFEMPPKGKLPDRVIADFERWIELGAPDPRDDGAAVNVAGIDIETRRKFWSFQPLREATPPADPSGWSRTAIDRFILARQRESGLQPNPPASARVLVRRAWFDLLGLPPTPSEIETWVGRLEQATEDGTRLDPQAWSELIDHLLNSPHYGERWARHWMDVARFAESHGYEQDYDRKHAYHYRDFLIQAFNSDLPYDDFVRWQVAGDELAPDRPLAWMATGFLGGGAFPTQLTEAEFESARYDELDDMVATTGVAFLGLSTGCARCHDHKFDPIPVSDYYRLAACFTTAIRSEKQFDLDPEGNEKRRREHASKVAQLQQRLDEFEQQQLPERFRAWLAAADRSQDLGTWRVLQGELVSSGGSKYELQADGSYLAVGETPAQEVLTFRAPVDANGLVAVRLEALAHDSLPRKGPGRAPNGNFALGNIEVAVVGKAGEAGNDAPRPVKLTSARATHQQNAQQLSVAASIDDDPVSGWAVDGQIGRDQAAVFEAEKPFDVGPDEQLVVTLTFNHPNTKHVAGRLRMSVTPRADAVAEVGSSGPPADVLAAVEKLKASDGEAPALDSPQVRKALDWFKSTLPEWQKLNQELAALKEKGPGVELTTVMVTSEGLPHMPHHADGRGFPHFYPQTFHLSRGDAQQKGDVAEPGFLQVLMRDGRDESFWQVEPVATSEHAPPKASYRRSALANWLTDVEYGAGQLAARVIVNRLWQHHFGRGLVATPNDFGASGERPTHPELLDWLAADLIRGGWKLKRVHKLIMTSGVYLQSTDYDAQRAAKDRENYLLWRRAPRRLEAEAIRDAMFTISGQLDTTMYGPGTLDESMRRRSVYFFIKRSKQIPMMMLFDWPEHLVSIGRRATTTTAPQALMFMNSPQARSSAEAFAADLPASADAAVTEAYLRAFGRRPHDRELDLAHAFLEQQTEMHQQTGQADERARQLARADLCQTLMSMNEFIYIE